MEITINFSQIVAIIWTMIAVTLSIIIVFAPIGIIPGISAMPWQIVMLLFFVSVLVLTLPVYLLLALFHFLSAKWSEAE